MRTKLAMTCFIAASVLTPAVGYSADYSKDTGKTTSGTATGAVKEAVGDAAITARIKTEFVKDKEVSALRIDVDTDNKGVVTLNGTVKTQAEADKAVSIARQTKGVTSVNNNLKVSSGTK